MIHNRLFISLLALAAGTFSAMAVDFPYQQMVYDIYYHCGFVKEKAAQAVVQISDYDGSFSAILDGRSRPVAGVIYCINDTLQSQFVPSGSTITPASENVMYMSGFYRKPHEGDRTDIESPSSYRTIYGAGTLSAGDATMECVTLTADMLCMFYYAKSVDFDSMQQGVAVDVPIRMPDGSERTLQLLYQGRTQYAGRPAYNMIANFTYGSGLSNYPITIMIDAERKIPLEFAASIDIGDVQMVFAY